ncbi:Hint domain-containing protein [Pseudoprimorskyibacter insulae]|uniref:Hedgehog/Intein (Hint) domain-containing protein n=1 Tax=Pseudoprimorskyibacter insulae TaxID=1695997 RepID=A0A2R8AQ61_9RHOB|nr:Hint domain-containing protein [Pseudoprimorskyibacter insulae]SPF77974.1 hypothetical protein PRI8871_00563 [Pseudoprimorskyibacter insulae]
MDITATYQTYNGALLAVNLFSSATTIFLGQFSSKVTSTLSDASGMMYVGETVTLAGQSYTMVGSGTAQPGINVLGLTVPTGFARDLVLLENDTTGDLVFVYPDGAPSATGMIALVVNLDPVGYNVGTLAPLCFAKGTHILTSEGPRPVQTLAPWDTVIDWFGEAHPVLNLCHCTLSADRAKATGQAPVKVVRDAIAPGVPYRSVMLSPNHNIFLTNPMPGRLVPIKSLIDGEKVKSPDLTAPIDYYHLVLPVHAVLVANGLPAESLLINDQTLAKLPPGLLTRLDRLQGRVPHFPLHGMRPAARILTRREVEETALWL